MKPEIHEISPSIVVKGIKIHKYSFLVPLQQLIWKEKAMYERNIWRYQSLSWNKTN